MEPRTETEKLIEGDGGYDYLARSIAIVTVLYEKGILKELIDAGKIDPEEIELRVRIIQEKYSLLQRNPEEEELPEQEESAAEEIGLEEE